MAKFVVSVVNKIFLLEAKGIKSSTFGKVWSNFTPSSLDLEEKGIFWVTMLQISTAMYL